MRNHDAEIDEGIDDEPRMSEKSDFRKDEGEGEGREAVIERVVVLDEDVASSAVANYEFEKNKDDSVGARAKDGCGAGSEEDCG